MISDADRADQMGQATREKLKQFIARIERLEAEKAELATDIREVYAEVKTFGFDAKVMRKVISIRRSRCRSIKLCGAQSQALKINVPYLFYVW